MRKSADTNFPFLDEKTHFPSSMAVFILRGHPSSSGHASEGSIKTGTRRIIRLDELSFERRLE